MDPGAGADALVLAGLAAYLVHVGVDGNAYALRVLSTAGVYGLLAIGYQFIFGHAGALALSQGTFMGIGAYASGLLTLRFGLPIWAALPIAVAAPVLLAALVGAPLLRLQTHYFALATLIIAQIALLAATEWRGLTGGANGLGGAPRLPPGWPMLAITWGLSGAGALLAWQLTRGRLGRAWACLREAPMAAASLGIDGARLRLAAFLLSAGYAGAAGSLYVHMIGVVSPDALSFPIVVTCLTIVVVGSRLRVAGALLGAVVVIELPEWFRSLRDFSLLTYGVILLLMVVAAPAGLLGALEALVGRLVRGAAPAPSPPMRLAPAPAAVRAPATGQLLEISAVSRRFGGVRALDSVSLVVRPGEALGLIGPNGSGKTTLVNLVSGLDRPDAGAIRLDGADIAGMAPHLIARAGVARTFQTVALVDGMTALDNVELAREAPGIGPWSALRGRGSGLARQEAAWLLDRLGALDDAMRPAGHLPHGVRRRVEIARALATGPRLLLLDEPAAGLTESGQADLARRLRALLADGMALLVIDHSMEFLAPLVDRVACLDAGRLIADGTQAAVAADPQVIRAYLGGAA